MDAHTISVCEAKSNLSKLISQAKAGQPFIITSHGKPQVIVQALEDERPTVKPSRIGFLKNELAGFKIPGDFNTMMQKEIIAMFEGERQ
jgi:prevent-host-death family protein